MLVFRADASIEIGTGHVMRCLALAKVLSAAGEQCQFICRELPGHLIEMIESHGIIVHRLPPPSMKSNDGVKPDIYAEWLGVPWQQDAQECSILLQKLQPDRVIVDHYALDKKWQQTALPEQTRLMVIDDLADRPHHCDILLDQNLGRTSRDYDQLLPAGCTRLIGPEFALLRPEFSTKRQYSLSRRKHGQMQNILISMGGVDKDNATGEILKVLARCELPAGIKVSIILGAKAPWIDDIISLASQMPFQTKLLSDVSNMAEEMAIADLAIGAAGGTSWERCCLGLPALLLVIAENQMASTKALADQKAAVFLGTLNGDNWSNELVTAVALLQNPNKLSELSQAAADICDGKGCEKVVEKITASHLSLRGATLEDSRPVWDWRYADGAERYYRNPVKPSYPDHESWFSNALNDSRIKLLILCQNNIPVGHLRVDISETHPECAEVSIYLSPNTTGKRIGRMALKLVEQFVSNLGCQKITAQVHRENLRSLKLFVQIGYVQTSELNNFISLEKQL